MYLVLTSFCWVIVSTQVYIVYAKVLGVDEAVPQRWLQFTPSVIDEGKCMARTWNGDEYEGQLGGQCRLKPLPGTRLCKRHGKPTGLAHGRVDGDIPDDKFAEFLRVSGGSSQKK